MKLIFLKLESFSKDSTVVLKLDCGGAVEFTYFYEKSKVKGKFKPDAGTDSMSSINNIFWQVSSLLISSLSTLYPNQHINKIREECDKLEESLQDCLNVEDKGFEIWTVLNH